MTALPLLVLLLVVAIIWFAISPRWKKAAPALRNAFLIIGALMILFLLYLIFAVQSAGPALHK